MAHETSYQSMNNSQIGWFSSTSIVTEKMLILFNIHLINFSTDYRICKLNITSIIITMTSYPLPSVLWCCWLGGRKGIQPVKTLWCGGVLAWLSVWVEVQICIWPSWCYCHSLSLAPANPDWFYLPVWKVYYGKTADWIRMSFGVVSGVGWGIGVLDG